ncbi:unnamed protein product [Cercospora beticola]|nr:unnamed protein product [Cercospora beticola]
MPHFRTAGARLDQGKMYGASRYTVNNLRTPIYIDAICLDQRDVEERSNQVGLMSEIYRNASRTVVWLGSCPHEQESNMASLRDQLADLELRNCPWNTASLVGLSFLCSRVYWRRLWIVQELLLSKKVDIHCGDFIFDLTALVDLVSLPSTQQLLPESHDASWRDCWKIARPRNYAEQSAQEGEIRDGWQPAVRLIHNRVKWLARRTDAGNAMPPSSGLPFHEALTAFRYHQCRERKDKVYALLGLLDEEGRSMMWSDYNCSKYSVFEQAAVTCLVSRWKSSDISARIGSQNYEDRQYCEMLASMLALHDLDVEFGISKATHGARSYMKEKDYAPGNTGQSVDLDEAHSQTIQQPLPRSHQSIGEGVGNGQCIFEQSLRLLRNELSSV